MASRRVNMRRIPWHDEDMDEDEIVARGCKCENCDEWYASERLNGRTLCDNCAINTGADIVRPRDRVDSAEYIDSHAAWYKGPWQRDVCECGTPIMVPSGTPRGRYNCNQCADRIERGGEY